MTYERWIALAVGIITVILTLVILALLERAESKVEVMCMDPTERERIRDIVLTGIDKGLEDQIKHLFEIWMKDINEQPKRAMVGTNNAVNAHVRARKQAVEWDPKSCAT
jgi:hypothetical protein